MSIELALIRLRRVLIPALFLWSLFSADTIAADTTAGKADVVDNGSETSRLTISVRNQRVSAVIKDKSLPEIFEALTKHVPLEVHYRQSTRDSIATQNISTTFENLSVEEGLERILKDRSHALRYSTTQAESDNVQKQQVIEVWLLNGSGAYVEMTSNDIYATGESTVTDFSGEAEHGLPQLEELSLEELMHTALSSDDPRIRETAMLHLGEQVEEPIIVDTFVAGLEDENRSVRQAALDELLTVDGNVPIESLEKIALQDPDPNLRKDALSVLVYKHRNAAISVLTKALDDFDPNIRSQAEILIVHLKAQQK